MVRVLVGCSVLAVAGPTFADTVFDLNVEFSGAQAPAGPGPWLTATFTTVVPGTVKLTMTSGGLSGSENVKDWYFNLNPAKDPTALSHAHVSGVAANSVSKAVNAYKADGDGFFDLLFAFPSGSGFNAAMTSVYTLSMPGLTDADFNFNSVEGGGNGSWGSAAHVQNTTGAGTGGSGWVGGQGQTVVTVIPLPAAAWMGMALLGSVGGVGFFRKRRQQVSV